MRPGLSLLHDEQHIFITAMTSPLSHTAGSLLQLDALRMQIHVNTRSSQDRRSEGRPAGGGILQCLPENSVPLLVRDLNDSDLDHLGKCG